MAASNLPLSVWSAPNPTNPHAEIAVGTTKLVQDKKGFWIVVLDRGSAKAVKELLHTDPTKTPDLGTFNTTDYILIASAVGQGLNKQPQGDFFKFLDVNGGGRELRRIDQFARQFNCGYFGTFGYALVGLLGNQNRSGFEASQIGHYTTGPILTLTLLATEVGGKTIYTPAQLSNS